MGDQEMKMDRRESRWTIDKHVPLAVILGMLLQTAALVWYMASFTSDTNNRIKNLEEYRIASTENNKNLPEKITRLEVEQAYTNRMLSQILTELRSPTK